MNLGPTSVTQLAQLARGYFAASLLHVAVDLRIVDRLAERPQTAQTVAEAGVDPAILHRIMRGLVLLNVLDELPDGRFGVTPLGAALREGAPESLRDSILFSSLPFHAFGHLSESVRRGRNAFELAHGRPFFDYLAERPELTSLFQTLMTARSAKEAVAVVAKYDFDGFATIVDVGGGHGALLSAILDANARATGFLLDRPEVIAELIQEPSRRCTTVVGDFFQEVAPAGADAYILSRVVHDWDDDDAVRILTTCRKAMSPSSKLLLVEAIMPRRASDQPAVLHMDLGMLAMVGGRERTEVEFGNLLHDAGLRLMSTTCVDEADGLHVLEATPDSS